MDFAILPKTWAPYTLALLRIFTGLLFLAHGTGKMLGFPALQGLDQMPHGLLVFTGLVELIGGVLIVAGFLTRPVAFILSGYSAVAYFMVHAPMGFFPVMNHGELAVLFCFAFLYLSAAGAGSWAVDKT